MKLAGCLMYSKLSGEYSFMVSLVEKGTLVALL